jgi:replicative DNA helicase
MNASAEKKKPPRIRSAYDPIWSAEGEQSVLGAILMRPEALDRVADLLAPEDFYQMAYARIFQAMLDLHRQSAPVDLVTVTALLKERGQLDGVGGYVFLAGLSERVGFATNAEYYANLVHDKALLQRLLDTTQEIASACLAPVKDVHIFLDAAERKIFSIGQTGRQRTALPLSKLVPPERELIESRYDYPDILGLKTGFADLDIITGGGPAGQSNHPCCTSWCW